MSTAAEQLDIFSERGRTEGTKRALSADPEWTRAATAALQRLAKTGAVFTADDLRREVGSGSSQGAAGAVITNAQNAGLIELVGYTRSSRVTRHANRIGLWKGAR